MFDNTCFYAPVLYIQLHVNKTFARHVVAVVYGK